ncbi:hypothetical protein U2261_10470 [Achromobacter xylosoxidans]|uniref:hypothetical protein n=1 Tax=Alcaligenes xylosoxydans xylosoxydans TaxID=85698 RepID=UPI002ACAD8B4|nr:hypothetical protein [Achromobacter xylosoxidans]MDZ5615032.1 hypothetical protein [Achromobacter xylosoxidans]MDZ5625764.1 hypothetical protein [Achromobacter xylosoxidans]MDZ5685331.1 hypothetical protein [Achromobacter xylosoxidans]
MNTVALPKTPIYKRVGFWLFMAFVASFIFISATGSKDADGNPSALAGFAAMMLPLLFIAMIVNFFVQRSLRKKKLTEIQARAFDDDLRSRIDRLSTHGLPSVMPEKLLLRPGEVAHFATVATLHEHKTTSVRHGGSSVRVRVAKGVSVSMGGGRSIPERELVQVASGELAATDQRIVFAGNGKSFDAPLGKIINVEYFKDGVMVNVSSRQNSFVVKMPLGESLILQETLNQILAKQS